VFYAEDCKQLPGLVIWFCRMLNWV
jgi:hypothetical protein